jgi:hypothetical protein
LSTVFQFRPVATPHEPRLELLGQLRAGHPGRVPAPQRVRRDRHLLAARRQRPELRHHGVGDRLPRGEHDEVLGVGGRLHGERVLRDHGPPRLGRAHHHVDPALVERGQLGLERGLERGGLPLVGDDQVAAREQRAGLAAARLRGQRHDVRHLDGHPAHVHAAQQADPHPPR